MKPDDNACALRGTPKCFCGLSASPAYSEEFGLLYECHYLHNNPWKEVTEEQSVVSEAVNGRGSPDSDQSNNSITTSNISAGQIDKPKKSICGYHIHKDAWDSFFDSNNITYPHHQELTICPFFNFTFCVFLNLRNSYPLSHPPPPNCFCGLPVTMRHVNNKVDRGKLMFTCPNYLIDGARPKCTWKLWANEVPFQRSNGCTHPLQKQGTTRLLDPSRQIQSLNRKNDNRNSVSRGRFGNNNKFYRHQRDGDRYSSHSKRDPNHHFSERLDHNHRREHDFGSRDQNQQPISNSGSSSMPRRISNGSRSSYSQKGWDPGRRGQPRQHGCRLPTRWDNNDSCREDNSNGQVINKNDSTGQQSVESNKPSNVDKNNMDKTTILFKSENDGSKSCRDKDLCNGLEKNIIISSDVESEMSDRKNIIPNNGESAIDKSAKNHLGKDIITDSMFVRDAPQTSPDSPPRSYYNEERNNKVIGSPSLSSRTNPSRLSIKAHEKEASYFLTFNEFSQTKPTIEKVAPSYNYTDETSRLLTENRKLLSENQSLISKQENDQVERNNLIMQIEKLKSEVNHLFSRVGHYKSEFMSEQKFRQSSQKKLIELQAQVADVMKEMDELRSSKEKEKEECAMGNMRCKVCFEETITHALLPCHHLALCGKCSQIITKCVICRKPKENVVRIYLG